MFNLPQKLNRSTNVEFSTSAPIAFKPLLCPSAFFRLFISSLFVVSWCVGFVALLDFLALVCALKKNTNVPPNALAKMREIGRPNNVLGYTSLKCPMLVQDLSLIHI